MLTYIKYYIKFQYVFKRLIHNNLKTIRLLEISKHKQKETENSMLMINSKSKSRIINIREQKYILHSPSFYITNHLYCSNMVICIFKSSFFFLFEITETISASFGMDIISDVSFYSS